MPILKTDIVEIFNKAISNKLRNIKISWKNEKCMTIVLCAKGYPGKYKKYLKIDNLQKIKTSGSDFIFHAGTQLKNDKVISNGGRVLNFTAIGKSFKQIRKRIIMYIKRLNWDEGFYRKDIGSKVIKK